VGFLILLEDAEGGVGIGEASPLPGFGTEDRRTCQSALEQMARIWVGAAASARPSTAAQEALVLRAPCAQAAFESAQDDLLARQQGLGLAELWRKRAREAGLAVAAGSVVRSVPVQALIGGRSPQDVGQAARAATEAGFRAFKLKIAIEGAAGLALDCERIAALRETVGPKALLRLDANEGYSRAAAFEALEMFSSRGFEIDYVEQPVVREAVEDLAWLNRHASIAVAADEALLGKGLEGVVSSRAAKVWIAKPAALGGFRIALRVALAAQQQDVRLVWSSLLDGAVSRAAALHWAAATAPSGEVQGLGTGPLLSADFEGGPRLESGSLVFDDGVGLGFDAKGLFSRPSALFSAAPVVFERTSR
jgi:o-succinylbenzoate synthase